MKVLRNMEKWFDVCQSKEGKPQNRLLSIYLKEIYTIIVDFICVFDFYVYHTPYGYTMISRVHIYQIKIIVHEWESTLPLFLKEMYLSMVSMMEQDSM